MNPGFATKANPIFANSTMRTSFSLFDEPDQTRATLMHTGDHVFADPSSTPTRSPAATAFHFDLDRGRCSGVLWIPI